MSLTAVYPGTFDPITNGHTDLVRRACGIFDRVVVGVAATGGAKQAHFDLQERVALAEQALEKFDNAIVQGFDGLLVEFAQQQNAKSNFTWLTRGFRF